MSTLKIKTITRKYQILDTSWSCFQVWSQTPVSFGHYFPASRSCSKNLVLTFTSHLLQPPFLVISSLTSSSSPLLASSSPSSPPPLLLSTTLHLLHSQRSQFAVSLHPSALSSAAPGPVGEDCVGFGSFPCSDYLELPGAVAGGSATSTFFLLLYLFFSHLYLPNPHL